MLTNEHFAQLRRLLLANDAQGIHSLVSQLSVADQKRIKLELFKILGDKKLLTFESRLSIYLSLLSTNLNLYFKGFLMAADELGRESAFWQNLDLLDDLGKQLSHTKAYYRQQLITCWIRNLKQSQDVVKLFFHMRVINPVIQLNYLIESDSLYAYYQFLLLCIKYDVEKAIIAKFCRQLLVRNEKLNISQNIREDVANFLIHFFDITALYYPFRRELDSTMFAYAEKSYESFLKVIIPASRINTYLENI